MGPDGSISDPTTGQTWGPLAILAPSEPSALESLRPVGKGLYLAPDEKAFLPAPDIRARQGRIESSNVDSLQEMVRMIMVQRGFAAMQRALASVGRMQGSLATNMLR
ncbi:MAG: hypothetical protein Fur0037_05590 [Planctomycetota bacterium]